MGKWLTKSDYLKFLIHPAYLWMAKYAKDKLPEFDEIGQANVDQGYAVEEMAQKLFKGGRLVDVPMFDGPDESAKLMREGGAEILFQPSVLTERRLYVRSDVMVRRGTSWDLYEIKGSASVKTAHLLDLAFQRYVWEEAGYQIGRSFVIHINNQYVRDGEIDPKGLFAAVEVTQQIAPLAKSTALKVEEAFVVMKLTDMPSDAPELAGEWYGYRDVYRYIHQDIPADSILNLTRLNLEQLKALAAQGISRIGDIPDDDGLKPQQVAQIEVVRSGVPVIHKGNIARSLSELVYPLYFLDYETFAGALPLWDGVRPFQQLPFQYSLHIQEAPGAQLIHREYLARGGDYPVEMLLAQMQTDLGPVGSVIVWNKSFEMGCNDAMAALHPQFAEFLASVNDRVYDLMEIFANGWYADARFMGSASIKKVLPVLVPELSYKDLGIGEGMTAQIRWMRAARGELTPEKMAAVYDHLVEYCGQDTLAMVRIYEVLTQELLTK
jgi:hypothetical protein